MLTVHSEIVAFLPSEPLISIPLSKTSWQAIPSASLFPLSGQCVCRNRHQLWLRALHPWIFLCQDHIHPVTSIL